MPPAYDLLVRGAGNYLRQLCSFTFGFLVFRHDILGVCRLQQSAGQGICQAWTV
jgi:hypothetical protein